MPRTRQIKPSTFANEVLGHPEADPLLTILFEALWCLADREGRLEDRPWKIKAFAFPYRNVDNPDAMLQWLADQGFIERYQAVEKAYIQIVNFEENQNVHPHEAKSVIPPNPAKMGVAASNDIGDQCNSMSPLPSFPSIPSFPSWKNGETPRAAKAAVTASTNLNDPWNGWLELLTQDANMTEAQARPFLGRLAKDFGKDLVMSSLADARAAIATEKPVDPKSFLIGVVRQRDKSKTAMYVGSSAGVGEMALPEPCEHCGSDVCLKDHRFDV